jgi:glycerol-3-phosphate cytidylyltransferase-like family protein
MTRNAKLLLLRVGIAVLCHFLHAAALQEASRITASVGIAASLQKQRAKAHGSHVIFPPRRRRERIYTVPYCSSIFFD